MENSQHARNIPGFVSVHSACYNNTIDRVTYKQQKFIPHSFGDWEVQEQGPGKIQCLVRTHFLIHRRLCSSCKLTWPEEEGMHFSGVSFVRVLIPFMRTLLI